MGDGSHFLDIILFALVAAFLAFRLRSVLGRRDGHQGPARMPLPSPEEGPDKSPDKSSNDNRAPSLESSSSVAAEGAAAELGASPVAAGLTQVRIADPRFNPDDFVSGAKIAFELVVSAYAAGDTEALRPLLSPEVFGNFAQSIKARQDAGEVLETQLVAIRSAEIVEAYMAGRTAHIGVRFVSEQTSVVRDNRGEVIEGDPHAVTEVIDTWTFARDTRSSDPNWTLVATDAAD
jgi:predicted lipid-binding transport protein (Tim44 family)